jgi:hypothetical protein
LQSIANERTNGCPSCLYRVGFPKIGHYDSWKIDLLQLLVEQNHGKRLYPYWVNASDWKDTAESFDVVAIHSEELHERMQLIQVDDEVRKKFSPELKFICEAMGVEVPFLPVHGEDERKLFVRLVREMEGPFNADLMSKEWCKFVNATSIFPKLPVHLRTYHEQYSRNCRVRDAVKSMGNESSPLEELNEQLIVDDDEDQLIILPPAAMARPMPVARRPPSAPPPVVAGTSIGIVAPDPTAATKKRTQGERGPDRIRRRQHRCARCLQFGSTMDQAKNCNGSGGKGRDACQFFDELGNAR